MKPIKNMKTLEQVLSFIEGWEFALETENKEADDAKLVLNVLKEIYAYANINGPNDEIREGCSQ